MGDLAGRGQRALPWGQDLRMPCWGVDTSGWVFFFFFPGRSDPCVAWWAGPPWESGLCRDASLRWRSSAFRPDRLPLLILPPSLSWSLFPSGTGLFGPPLAGAPDLAFRWTTLCSPSFQQQSLHVHGGCGPSPGGGLVTMKFTI